MPTSFSGVSRLVVCAAFFFLLALRIAAFGIALRKKEVGRIGRINSVARPTKCLPSDSVIPGTKEAMCMPP